MNADDHVKEVVRKKYGQAARRVSEECAGGGCETAATSSCCDPMTSNLCDVAQSGQVPAAGIAQARIEVTRVYRFEQAHEFLAGQGAEIEALAREVDGKFASAFVRAVKPGGVERPARAANPAATEESATACCAPSCCGRDPLLFRWAASSPPRKRGPATCLESHWIPAGAWPRVP